MNSKIIQKDSEYFLKKQDENDQIVDQIIKIK